MGEFKQALDSPRPCFSARLRGEVGRGSRGTEKLNQELRRTVIWAGLEKIRYVEIVLSELIISTGDLLVTEPEIRDCVYAVEEQVCGYIACSGEMELVPWDCGRVSPIFPRYPSHIEVIQPI